MKATLVKVRPRSRINAVDLCLCEKTFYYTELAHVVLNAVEFQGLQAGDSRAEYTGPVR